jgi:hypothetical protein
MIFRLSPGGTSAQLPPHCSVCDEALGKYKKCMLVSSLELTLVLQGSHVRLVSKKLRGLEWALRR